MKKSIMIILCFLFSILCLTACPKNQNDSTTTNAVTNNPNMNNTNYQEMMREQTAQAASIAAEHPHVGGHR